MYYLALSISDSNEEFVLPFFLSVRVCVYQSISNL